MRFSFGILLTLVACLLHADATARVDCTLGSAVAADIGDGVVMHTCLWQKSASELVRVGPLLLVKNGVPILSAQTNRDGKLHGNFATWHDDGRIMESGAYENGRKQGTWLRVDERGRRTTLQYLDGRLIGH